MREELGEVLVRSLRHARRLERRGALARVVIDVEVLGLEDAPVEGVVLHLVLAELSARRGAGATRERECETEAQVKGAARGTPPAPPS